MAFYRRDWNILECLCLREVLTSVPWDINKQQYHENLEVRAVREI
jgi:hypothetical protein